jgi:hypothetical protein
MNHTERIAHVARQRRGLTRNLVDEVVDLYLETLATEIAAGEWTDIPGIGKMQVIQEETKGTLKSIVAGGQRETRKPGCACGRRYDCTKSSSDGAENSPHSLPDPCEDTELVLETGRRRCT